MSAATPRVLVVALCVGGITVALMHTLVVPLLPVFPELLGVSRAQVSWLVTATMLAGVVGAPVFGRLGDLFGKRRILLLVLGIMLAGSVLGAVSWSYGPLLVARALQGAAFGVIPLGISLLKDALPADRAGSAVALMSSTLGIGGAIGLPVAGVLPQYTGWHALFWLASAMSAASLLLAWRFVPESPVRAGGRFDVPGAVGLSAALICLLLPVSQGSEWGWTSPRTLGLFAASVVIFLGWGAYQLRVDAPLVNLRTSARPMVLLTNLAAILVGVGMFTSFVLIGQVMQAPVATGYGFGTSLAVAGIAQAPTGISMLIFAPLSARLSNAHGAQLTLLVGCVLLAATNLVQAMLPGSLLLVVMIITVAAAGTALTYAAMPTVIMEEAPPTETSAANGLNTVMRTIGTSTCSAAMGAILVTFTMTADGQVLPAPAAYQLAFGIAAGCSAVAAVLACFLVALRRRRTAAIPLPELVAENPQVTGPADRTRNPGPAATRSGPGSCGGYRSRP
ncbi:MAG TPA: MFS transporter [Actinophytocola sp.]|uniref:MFS transporter n=1 Tax=Actinophytocola sp. TaxID=1872138 RepID=UPI002DB77F34|nr:MFS transporter [Actinophytocola sp.]HEU5469467.1 MFS transporter [Actinophytocola sp.]